MTQWGLDNHAVLQLVLSLATVPIWLVYLQLIPSNHLRQRRPMIPIHLGAGAAAA